MDNAINATCNRRKFVPAQCSLFLDKTLKLQVDAAKRIKTKVRSVEPLTVPPQVQLSNRCDHHCFFARTFLTEVLGLHILQKAQVTLNKMVHKKRHHFPEQFSMPFHMV